MQVLTTTATNAKQNVLTVEQTEFISLIGSVKMPRFISILGYSNKEGDVSNYVININNKYSNKVKKDVGQLKQLLKDMPKDEANALAYMAATELLNSFLNNGNKETASAQSLAQSAAYTKVNGAIKQHNETGKHYIFGYVVSKQVISRAERKPVKSRALTIAKDAIRRTLRTSKYVNFSIDLANFGITVEGSTLVLKAK